MPRAKFETTKLSSKGQVILPKKLRDEFRWLPGTTLRVEKTSTGLHLTPVKPDPPLTIDDVYGCLPTNGHHLKIEDFDKVIAAEVKARHARGRY